MPRGLHFPDGTLLRIPGATATIGQVEAASAASGAPALDLTVHPETYAAQVQPLITVANDPMIVWQATSLSHLAATYSKGRVPVATDDVVVQSGATLEVQDGQTLTLGFIRVNNGCTLDIKPGGTIESDTIYLMPGATLRWSSTRAKPVEFRCRNDSNIDVSRDEHLISRGIIAVEGAIINGSGHAMQRVLPCTADILKNGTSLTLGHEIFFPTAISPNGEDFAFDWAIDDRLILTATDPLGQQNGPVAHEGNRNDYVEITSVVGTTSSGAFGQNDPNGIVINFTPATTHKHRKYQDQAALDLVLATGPPAIPGEAETSHANWVGRPHVVNVTRSARFTLTTPNSPAHRRPHWFNNARDVQVGWSEFVGWGRSNYLEDTILAPETPVNPSPTDNIRHRNAVHNHLCGFVEPTDSTTPVPTYTGCTIHGGSLGNSWTNSEQGRGSFACGFTQYNCQVNFQACVSYNTIGSGFMSMSHWDTGNWNRCAAIDTHGQEIAGTVQLPDSKDTNDQIRFDGGRGGNGYWAYGRMIRHTRNLAYGNAGAGLEIFSRGIDGFSVETKHTNPQYIQHEFRETSTDPEAAFIRVEGMYSSGNRQPMAIIKDRALQRHGIMSSVINCISIADWVAYNFQYTGQYVLKNLFWAGPEASTADPPGPVVNRSGGPFSAGIDLGTNLYGFQMIRPIIANANIGILVGKGYTWTQPKDDTLLFRVLNPTYRNVTTEEQDIDGDPLLAAELLNITETDGKIPDEAKFGLALDPVGTFDGPLGTETMDITGTLTDSLGSFPWPIGKDISSVLPEQIRISRWLIDGILQTDGFYTDGADEFILYPLWFSDRVTGATRVALYPIKFTNLRPPEINFAWTGKSKIDNGADSYATRLATANGVLAFQ